MWILGLEGLRTTREHNSTRNWQAPPPGLEKSPIQSSGTSRFSSGQVTFKFTGPMGKGLSKSSSK